MSARVVPLALAVALVLPVAPARAATRITSTSGIPHHDVGNVSRSPAWAPSDPRGYTLAWSRYLKAAAELLEANDPHVVIHGGDMVEGRWQEYRHPEQGDPLGPAGATSIRNAARVYHRWISRRLPDTTIYAMGDHEIGDIAASGVVAPSHDNYRLHHAYKKAWRAELGRNGRSRYSIRRGDGGILVLDPFKKWTIGVVPVLSRSDRRWLAERIATMRGNGVRWTVPAVGRCGRCRGSVRVSAHRSASHG